MKTTASRRATKIKSAAREYGGYVFIFILDRYTEGTRGTRMITLPPGDKADKMIRDFPNYFYGVYTEDCPRLWIINDLPANLP